MLTLIKKKNTNEMFTGERCHITELLNDEKSPQLSKARCRVEPGVLTQLHALRNTRETYIIEQGGGEMDDGENSPFEVCVGDAVVIEGNHAQRIRNTGTEDLVFLVLCTPRFVPECYINLEDE